jgi:hypothetical protein
MVLPATKTTGNAVSKLKYCSTDKTRGFAHRRLLNPIYYVTGKVRNFYNIGRIIDESLNLFKTKYDFNTSLKVSSHY